MKKSSHRIDKPIRAFEKRRVGQPIEISDLLRRKVDMASDAKDKVDEPSEGTPSDHISINDSERASELDLNPS